MFSARFLFTLAVLLTSPALASAQLRFTTPTVEMGELRGGPVYDQRFDFVNDSAQPLEITDIRLGCGCLQAVLDKRVFAASEKGSLRLNIRTLGQPNGMRTWQAHVQYRQGRQTRETTLIVAATIRNEITIEPSIIAMTVETALKQEVTITDHRPMPRKVTAVLASSPAIRVTTQPTANGVTRVTLEVSASALTAARQEETLNIYSDDPYYRQLQVPITLTKAARPTVTATPDQVEIVGAGSQLVRLRGSGDKAVRIDKAETNNAGIKCTWAAGPGNDATLKISVDASARWRAPSTPPRVLVHIAEPAGATLTIPVVLRNDEPRP
jgi:hypothetical protein